MTENQIIGIGLYLFVGLLITICFRAESGPMPVYAYLFLPIIFPVVAIFVSIIMVFKKEL